MSGSKSERYLGRLAEAVAHFGDAVVKARISPERIHAIADDLELARRGQIVSLRLRSREIADDKEGDKRATMLHLRCCSRPTIFSGAYPFRAAA